MENSVCAGAWEETRKYALSVPTQLLMPVWLIFGFSGLIKIIGESQMQDIGVNKRFM